MKKFKIVVNGIIYNVRELLENEANKLGCSDYICRHGKYVISKNGKVICFTTYAWRRDLANYLGVDKKSISCTDNLTNYLKNLVNTHEDNWYYAKAYDGTKYKMYYEDHVLAVERLRDNKVLYSDCHPDKVNNIVNSLDFISIIY